LATRWDSIPDGKSKPILFLSLIAAALSEMLNVRRVIISSMMQMLSEKVVVVGEKRC